MFFFLTKCYICSRQQRNKYTNYVAVIIHLHPPPHSAIFPLPTKQNLGSLFISITLAAYTVRRPQRAVNKCWLTQQFYKTNDKIIYTYVIYFFIDEIKRYVRETFYVRKMWIYIPRENMAGYQRI